MKKNFSTRIFNLLCKRVFKLSKKRKLGWTWNDCQRWTSANLFKQYKGKPISKIKITEVDSNIVSILDKVEKEPLPEVCSSVFLVPDVDLLPLEYWWDFDKSKFPILNNDLNIRIVVDGIVDTGIVKYRDIDLTKIRETFRTFYKNSYPDNPPLYVFKRMYKHDKLNSDNPCDSYLLLSEEGSGYDLGTEDEAKKFVRVSELPKETQKQRQESKVEAKKTKAEIKKTALPKKVEGKETEPKPKEVSKKQKELSKTEQLQLLRKDYDDGLFTLEEYKIERRHIIDNN